METFEALFNTILIIFIVTTMLSAGFNTTVEQVTNVMSKIGLVAAVLVVGLVVRPLIGWGTAEVFSLATPAFVAMALLWACPGAPIGSKLVTMADADLQSGAVLQVLLASIGSITFAPTANVIISAAGLGDDVSLPVGDLILTVAALQLIPFAAGLITRHWAEAQATEWDQFAVKVSGTTFLFVVAGALLGSWRTVVDLVGSRVLLAAIVASAIIIAVGYFASGGESATKRAAALIQPCTNAGPAFAATAIAFDNDPEILGAMTAILLLQIVVGLAVAAFFAQIQAPSLQATGG